MLLFYLFILSIYLFIYLLAYFFRFAYRGADKSLVRPTTKETSYSDRRF